MYDHNSIVQIKREKFIFFIQTKIIEIILKLLVVWVDPQG